MYKTDSSHHDTDIFNHVTNIHNVIGSPVTCIDVRSSPSQLAVGLGSYGGALDPYRVIIFFYLMLKNFNQEWKTTHSYFITQNPLNLFQALYSETGDFAISNVTDENSWQKK